jgi:hypothetical protein
MSLTKVSSAVLNVDDLYGFRNRIINGDMRIDQRNAGAAVTNANGYIVDRLQSNYFGDGTGRWTAQQITDAPSGFTNSFRVTVTTTDASPSSSFAYRFATQSIEGNNVADLGWGTASASTVTISFWVKSSVTGAFPCVIHNAATTRGYGILYDVNSANTWEYKTFTVPGDTLGTWSRDNSSGISIGFGSGGSVRTISANLWNDTGGATPTTVTGAVNLLATSGATWQITGLQLEKGTVATPFERRPYGTELALCQRYYLDTTVAFSEFYNGNGNNVRYSCNISFPTTMRVAPTITFSNISATLTNSDDAEFISVNGFAYRVNMTVTGSASRYSAVRCTSEF